MNYIDPIRMAINNIDQNTLFSKNDVNYELVNSCIGYLKSIGYRIVKPVQYNYVVKNVSELREFFYSNMYKYISPYTKVRPKKTDFIILNDFIKNRMDCDDIDHSNALNECTLIIETIFKNLNKFNFNFTINTSILTQGKMKWVTDYAVDMINKERSAEIKRKYEDNYRKFNESVSIDYNEVLKELEELC